LICFSKKHFYQISAAVKPTKFLLQSNDKGCRFVDGPFVKYNNNVDWYDENRNTPQVYYSSSFMVIVMDL
jgi:hypothetical protein